MHQTETLLSDHWQLFLSNFAAISVQARLPSHPRCGAAVKVGFHAPPLSKFHLYSSCQYQPLQLCKIDNFVDFFCIAHNSHYRHCRRGSSALFSGWCTFQHRKRQFFGLIWPIWGNWISSKKNSKWPYFFWTIFGYSGPQSVDIRSTFGVPLKFLGYNDSNELCGRLVASGAQIT